MIPDRFKNAPIAEAIGFDVAESEDGNVSVVLDVTEKFWNPMGKLQGGVLAILADTAMGIAYGRELSANTEFATVDFSIQYIRPVSLGRVQALGRLVQRGVRVGFAECLITDHRGKTVATARCTCMSIVKQKGNSESTEDLDNSS